MGYLCPRYEGQNIPTFDLLGVDNSGRLGQRMLRP
ncbi:MAG: hypothetical protein RL577_1521 [Bacteroidota bacterium]